MSRKSGKKWSTKKCGRCGGSHAYSGKLDVDNLEYVVCGVTNKRININPAYQRLCFYTKWVRSPGRLRRWLRICTLRLLSKYGFKLTSDERSELAFRITRNVTKSNEETLREVTGEVDEFGGKFVYCPYIPSIITPTLKGMGK